MDATAEEAFEQGDLTSARRLLQGRPDLRRRQLEMLATIEYLEGRYQEAIGLLHPLLVRSRVNRIGRSRISHRLSLCYFQTNQFGLAATLGRGDPLTKLMRSFREAPNTIDWKGRTDTRIPFRQDTLWHLPRIDLTVNGQPLTARIDTGGDLLSVPWSMAESLGTKPVATSTGWFAGGARAGIGWSQAAHVGLGEIAISNVPISINSFEYPVVGTGLLRQFLATLDYPEGRLILRPRGAQRLVDGEPFLLAGTHLMLVNGSIAGVPTKLLVDSGLEADNDASFLASDTIMQQAGIPTPEKTRSTGKSGAGTTQLEVGSFSATEVSLGSTMRSNLIGLTGIFPKQLAKTRTLGFPLGGLVSHNFLRHYRWTLDFDQMRMTLEQPQPAS